MTGSTESLLFKLIIVGIPFALPFITALLFAFWWTRRGRNEASPRMLHIIAALVMFQVGILGTLASYYVKDERINRANAERYEEASRKIQVGMTKAEVSQLIGAPTYISFSKDGYELWHWRSFHRLERKLAYKIIGKSVYEPQPFLLLSFDTSKRVAIVETNGAW